MTPRGLVLGNYHRRNAGDDRLMQIITCILDGHDLTFGQHRWLLPSNAVSEFDYVILGGGSIASPANPYFADGGRWIRSVGRPVLCCGVSASGDESVVNSVVACCQSGGLCWTRDVRSRNNVRGQGTPADESNNFAAPDLAWLIPLPNFPQNKNADTTLINLRPFRGRREVDPAAWADALRRLPQPEPWPLCFTGDADRLALAQVFPAHEALKEDEFHLAPLARARLVVTMRFHAAIFAVQAGVPLVGIQNTRKLDDLFDALGLTEYLVPNDRPDLLAEAAERARVNQSPTELRARAAALQQATSVAAGRVRALVDQVCELHSAQRHKHRRRYSFRVASWLRRRGRIQ